MTRMECILVLMSLLYEGRLIIIGRWLFRKKFLGPFIFDKLEQPPQGIKNKPYCMNEKDSHRATSILELKKKEQSWNESQSDLFFHFEYIYINVPVE